MNKKLFSLLCLVLIGGLLLCACSPTPTEGPVATEAPAAIEAPAVEEPTEEPVATEPPEDIVLWFKVLRGAAQVNGYEVYDGEIKEGDVLSTDLNCFVELWLPGDDRVLFEIKPNTSVIIEKVTSYTIRLFLEVGTIRTSVVDNAGLSVTIAAEAGESEAEKTAWISEVDTSGALLVAVLEGRVVARTQDKVEVVEAGERLDISPDGVPGWPASTIYIYFDLTFYDPSHTTEAPYTLEGQYRRMDDKLSEADSGCFIEASINLELSPSYDVLILTPNITMTDEYIEVIQDWVLDGHGLFFMGEWRDGVFDQTSSNKLLEPFGIEFLDREQEESTAYLDPGHPVTLDVEQLELNWYGQLEGGIPLGYAADTDVLVLAAYENGGRVLVLADSNSLDNDAWDRYPIDNTTFILNAMEWLAGPQ